MPLRTSVAALAVLLVSGASSHALERKPYVETKMVEPVAAVPPCPQDLELARQVRLEPGQSAKEALKASLDAERMLGVEENVTVESEGDRGGAFLRVRYPEGSINFGSSREGHPLGGASFYVPRQQGERSCLHYRLRFPEDFDFAKGGKLPGLFAGEAPSGGSEVTGRGGWTIRLMWREKGKGELYEYVYNMEGKYGASIGRGAFRFPRGRWIDIDLETRINDPEERNGAARLWVDGELVIEQTDIVFATRGGKPSEGGLLFSTFFGGNDEGWASPKNQYIDFSDFRLYGGVGD